MYEKSKINITQKHLLVLSVLGLMIVSCNSGASNNMPLTAIQYVSSKNATLLTKINVPSTVQAINAMSKIAGNGGLVYASNNSMKDYLGGITNCGNRSNYIMSIVNADSNGDIVYQDSLGNLSLISNYSAGQINTCSGGSSPIFPTNRINFYPLATDQNGKVFYSQPIQGLQASNSVIFLTKIPLYIYKSFNLKFTDSTKFIELDNNKDGGGSNIFVIGESGSGNNITDDIYFSWAEGNMNQYFNTSTPVTAAALSSINGNDTGFWAGTDGTLNYTNIGNQNQNQPQHHLENFSLAPGEYATQISVNPDKSQITLATSMGNVHILTYKFNESPGGAGYNHDYNLFITDDKIYKTGEGNSITSMVNDPSGTIYVGTANGNIYGYLNDNPSDDTLSNLSNPYTAGSISNGCTSLLSATGNVYERCIYNHADPYTIKTPQFAQYISTYGYGGGGGGGTSCTSHEGTFGGSGIGIMSYNTSTQGISQYLVQVGGGGGGSTGGYYGGGGGGGGYSSVCTDVSCATKINIAGGGGGGGTDCFDTVPNSDYYSVGGNAGNNGGGGARNRYNSKGDAGGSYGANGIGGYGGCAATISCTALQNITAGGGPYNGGSGVDGGRFSLSGTGGYNGGGAGGYGGSLASGPGGGGGGYGGGGAGGSNPNTDYHGGGGGGGGGSYSITFPNGYNLPMPNSGNGGGAAPVDFNGKNGGDGYEYILFSAAPLQNPQ